MKKTIITFSLSLVALGVLAQEEEKPKYWTFKGMMGLNAAQTAFWNWSAGGENTVAGNVYLNVGAYFAKDGHTWDTDLATEYGLIYSQAYEGSTLDIQSGLVSPSKGVRKNMDKFELSTKYGYGIGEEFYVSAIADLKTQYDKGYKYTSPASSEVNGVLPQHEKDLTSAFFSPAYSNVSVGVDYKKVPGLTLYLSPVAGKFTFVTTPGLRESYGVDADKSWRAELGAYFKAGCNYDLGKNKMVNIKSTLDLFTSYLDSPFVKIDVNWDLFVGVKVLEYLSVTLSTSLKYDDDILIDGVNSKIQFKEVLGLGVSYNFQ